MGKDDYQLGDCESAVSFTVSFAITDDYKYLGGVLCLRV